MFADTARRVTVRGLEAMAEEDLRDRWQNYRDEFGDPGDVVHEIADSCVPVYTSDLIEGAADDLALATDTPELGPAFDGSPTPTNIIAANIYERITDHLWDVLRTLEGENGTTDPSATTESGS